MTIEDMIVDMEDMLGRELTHIEFRIARFSYYNGMANGITRVTTTEMRFMEDELDGVSTID